MTLRLLPIAMLALATIMLPVKSSKKYPDIAWSWDPIPLWSPNRHDGNCTQQNATDSRFYGTATITPGKKIKPDGWDKTTVATCQWCPHCPDPGYTWWLHCTITTDGKLMVVSTRNDDVKETGPAVSANSLPYPHAPASLRGCSLIIDRGGDPLSFDGKCCFPPSAPTPAPPPPSPAVAVKWSWDQSASSGNCTKQHGTANITPGAGAQTEAQCTTGGFSNSTEFLECEVVETKAGPSLTVHYTMLPRIIKYDGASVTSGCSTVLVGGKKDPLLGKCCFTSD